MLNLKNLKDHPIVVIYHGDCLDGFGAAWSVRQCFQDHPRISFHPAFHGNLPPDVDRNTIVIIVDFSFKRPILKKLCEQSSKVILVDHHVSALKDLEGLEQEHANLSTTFDMNRSGAVLSWNFFQKSSPPELLRYIQDKDLWLWELPKSREINTALRSYPMTFDAWTPFFSPQGIPQLIQEGTVLCRYIDQMIESFCRRSVMVE
ncbi:MAG: phosphoesterase, partial [SAR324 cluster bacterium]|nr:phosphoesterase [SAR324 cluster bacterium]